MSTPSKGTPPSTSAGVSASASGSGSGNTGTESFYLPPRELSVVGISAERRVYLHDKLDALVRTQPGSVKRPRSEHNNAVGAQAYSQKRPHSSSSAASRSVTPRPVHAGEAESEPRKRRHRHKATHTVLPTPPLSPEYEYGANESQETLLPRPSTAPLPNRRSVAESGSSSSGMDTGTDDDVMYVLSGDLEMQPIPVKAGKSKSKKKAAAAANQLPPPPPIPSSSSRRTESRLSTRSDHSESVWLQAVQYDKQKHDAISLKGKRGQHAQASVQPPLTDSASTSARSPATPGFRGAEGFAANNIHAWSLSNIGMYGPGRNRENQRARSVGPVGNSSQGGVLQLTQRMGGLLDPSDGVDALEQGEESESSSSTSLPSRGATPTPVLVPSTSGRGTTPSPFMFSPPLPSLPSLPAFPPLLAQTQPRDRREIQEWENELGRIESSSRKRTAQMGPAAAPSGQDRVQVAMQESYA